MKLDGKTIGFAITGSFCTINEVIPKMKKLIQSGAKVIPIMSEITLVGNNRFIKGDLLKQEVEEICGINVITSIEQAEPIGPKNLLDALIIAPCTGNTLAKIANGVTDTCVTMAAKSNLRNSNPLIIAISSNDALSANMKNIGEVLNRKNIYLVPFRQDDSKGKPASLVAKMDLIEETACLAFDKIQIQPLLV